MRRTLRVLLMTAAAAAAGFCLTTDEAHGRGWRIDYSGRSPALGPTYATSVGAPARTMKSRSSAVTAKAWRWRR